MADLNALKRVGKARWIGISISQLFKVNGPVDLSVPGMLTPPEFKKELKLERARADRTGCKFTVGYFRLLDPQTHLITDSYLNSALASAISNRIRSIDRLGDSGQSEKGIGTIFPGAQAEKLTNLIAEIENAFLELVGLASYPEESRPKVHCVLHNYPSSSLLKEKSSEPAIDPARGNNGKHEIPIMPLPKNGGLNGKQQVVELGLKNPDSNLLLTQKERR